MSLGITYLHSHSGLEREIKYPKHKVLVDEKFENELLGTESKESIKFNRMKHDGVTYIEVPIALFVNKRGVFKNLSK